MKYSLPEKSQKSAIVHEMFDAIAHRYDFVNRLISLGLDMRWRRRSLDQMFRQPIHRPTDRSHDSHVSRKPLVVDLACGTGDFCALLQRRGYNTIGIDLSMNMMRHAHVSVPFVQADVLALPLQDASCDGATCGFGMRNFTDLPPFFAELARVVRPGGRIALLDAGRPKSRALRIGHRFYFGQVVPLIGRVFSVRSAYAYLPQSLEYLPDSEVLTDMLRSAGFGAITHKTFLGGSAQLFTATRN